MANLPICSSDIKLAHLAGIYVCIHNDDVVESTTSLPLHTVGTIVDAEAVEIQFFLVCDWMKETKV